MIFRALFLTIFCILSISCASTGDKSSNGSTSTTTSSTDSKSKTDAIKGPKEAGDDANIKITGNSTRKPSKTKKLATGKALELPPDLVGSANATVVENAEAIPDFRVLPEIVGARIIRQDGDAWLEIDTNVESAWKTITEYWASYGVNLVDYNPEAGTMETDWIAKSYEIDDDDSAIKTFFKGFAFGVTKRHAEKDKFRIRFERISPEKTAMYVTHRVSEVIENQPNGPKNASVFEWVERPSNPETVADLLQNIILIFDESASV